MRLRQAHAILEAATSLEAAGLGFEMYPFDHEDSARPTTEDQMTGAAYFDDRVYSVALRPGADGRSVEAVLEYGLGADPSCLLRTQRSVVAPDDEGIQFRGLVGADLAKEIANVVRKHEKPNPTIGTR